MLARQATADGTLETIIDGKLETTKTYNVGDYILKGTDGEEYTMSEDSFSSRYDVGGAQDTADEALAAEGFKLYKPTGRAWAEQLDENAVATHFPAGKFIASWGSEMVMEPG